jgi:hypothetical protein
MKKATSIWRFAHTEKRIEVRTGRRDAHAQRSMNGAGKPRFTNRSRSCGSSVFRVLFEGHAEQSLASQATSVFNSAFFRIAGQLGEYPPDTIVAVLYTEQQFRDCDTRAVLVRRSVRRQNSPAGGGGVAAAGTV